MLEVVSLKIFRSLKMKYRTSELKATMARLWPNTQALGAPPRSLRKIVAVILEQAEFNNGRVELLILPEEFNTLWRFWTESNS